MIHAADHAHSSGDWAQQALLLLGTVATAMLLK
jgi:hypothetical protein